MHITGTEINYLHVCHRKLWLFHNGIRPEFENDLVQLGRLLQDTSYPREEKDIPIGTIGVVDWADWKNGIIHETKRGKTPGAGDEAQVGYYMWYLNAQGLAIHQAVLHYPLQRRTKNLGWNTELADKIEADLKKCEDILSGPLPPVKRYGYCKNCSYESLCFA